MKHNEIKCQTSKETEKHCDDSIVKFNPLKKNCLNSSSKLLMSNENPTKRRFKMKNGRIKWIFFFKRQRECQLHCEHVIEHKMSAGCTLFVAIWNNQINLKFKAVKSLGKKEWKPKVDLCKIAELNKIK